MTLEDLARGAIDKAIELQTELAALKEELELQETWRKLAIQFDGHRMQAMGLLKAVAIGAATSEDCAEFVKLPPLSALEITEQAQSLKARVAELEKEDTLWAMLDAIEQALFRRAAPHAWEAIVTEAGMKFITDRRKEPANEG